MKTLSVERLSKVISLVDGANKKLVMAMSSEGSEGTEWEEIAEALHHATDEIHAVVMFVDKQLKALKSSKRS